MFLHEYGDLVEEIITLSRRAKSGDLMTVTSLAKFSKKAKRKNHNQ